MNKTLQYLEQTKTVKHPFGCHISVDMIFKSQKNIKISFPDMCAAALGSKLT